MVKILSLNSRAVASHYWCAGGDHVAPAPNATEAALVGLCGQTAPVGVGRSHHKQCDESGRRRRAAVGCQHRARRVETAPQVGAALPQGDARSGGGRERRHAAKLAPAARADAPIVRASVRDDRPARLGLAVPSRASRPAPSATASRTT